MPLVIAQTARARRSFSLISLHTRTAATTKRGRTAGIFELAPPKRFQRPDVAQRPQRAAVRRGAMADEGEFQAPAGSFITAGSKKAVTPSAARFASRIRRRRAGPSKRALFQTAGARRAVLAVAPPAATARSPRKRRSTPFADDDGAGAPLDPWTRQPARAAARRAPRTPATTDIRILDVPTPRAIFDYFAGDDVHEHRAAAKERDIALPCRGPAADDDQENGEEVPDPADNDQGRRRADPPAHASSSRPRAGDASCRRRPEIRAEAPAPSRGLRRGPRRGRIGRSTRRCSTSTSTTNRAPTVRDASAGRRSRRPAGRRPPRRRRRPGADRGVAPPRPPKIDHFEAENARGLRQAAAADRRCPARRCRTQPPPMARASPTRRRKRPGERPPPAPMDGEPDRRAGAGAWLAPRGRPAGGRRAGRRATDPAIDYSRSTASATTTTTTSRRVIHRPILPDNALPRRPSPSTSSNVPALAKICERVGGKPVDEAKLARELERHAALWARDDGARPAQDPDVGSGLSAGSAGPRRDYWRGSARTPDGVVMAPVLKVRKKEVRSTPPRAARAPGVGGWW